MNYNPKSYRLLIRRALEVGFTFVDYFTIDFRSARKQVILRHDIDVSPLQALKMAEIDASLGIQSIFAALVSSPYYNLFDRENSRAVRRINELGHHVILHYYRPEPPVVIRELAEDVKKEFSVLEKSFPFCQKVFCWHDVGPLESNVELVSLKIPGFVNTYRGRFTTGMKYLSDSVMRYRPEELMDFLSRIGMGKIHLLIHPCFWIGEMADMSDFFVSLFVEGIKRIDTEAQRSRFWREHFPAGLTKKSLERFRVHFYREIRSKRGRDEKKNRR